MEYTKDDVIIWSEDERLENAIGKKCYYLKWDYQTPKMLLDAVNRGEAWLSELRVISEGDAPFGVTVSDFEFGIPFIILKKEPIEELIPFDFSCKEDRDALLGKRVISYGKDGTVVSDKLLTGFITTDFGMMTNDKLDTGDTLFEQFVFADTGKPVGKVVEH